MPRPDGSTLPLLLHVFGAMVLVGGLLGATVALAASRRARLLQGLGFRLLFFVALPGYVLMRIGAEWIYSKEGFSGDNEPDWIGVGYLTSDLGALVLLVTLIVAGLGARKARSQGGGSLSRAGGVLAGVLLATYLVTVWAMSAKPG